MSTQDSTNNDTPTITSNDDAIQAAAANVSPNDVVTGEDDNFTIWQAPASDGAYDGWPDIPRRPPRSDAHRVLHNTSIDERDQLRDRPEPTGPTRAQTQAQQAAVQAEIEADQRAEREERAAEEEARERQATVNADRAGDELREHQSKQPALIEVWEMECLRWLDEDPDAAADFNEHITYVQDLATEDVRSYDLICWFKRLPQHVQLPLNSLARSFHEESRLRVVLSGYERNTAAGSPPISQIQREAAAGAEIKAEGHGLETDPELHCVTIGTFVPPRFDTFDTQEQEAIWLRASFELRKVRVEHEQDPALRWPQCKPFENSLDNSVREWLRAAYRHYVDDQGQPRHAIINLLAWIVADIQAYEQAQGWP